jgi:hypothetical protein
MKKLLFLLSLATAGCPSSSGSLPLINSFGASPGSVHLGNKATLSWDVSNATSLSIDHAVGTVTGNSVDVTPTATTTYTLTATGSGGSVTAPATVTVLPAIATPVITDFQASPNAVPFNGQTTLSWTVTGTVTSLSVTDGTTPSDVTGQTSKIWQVGSASSYTFTLTATNDGGSTTRTALLTTHPPNLHLQYTDPTSSSAKILMVRNASSIANRLVLDVKVGASPITAFGFAMNIPVHAESNGMFVLDPGLSPVGLIGGGAINFSGSTQTAAAILGGPAMPNVFSVGVAKLKANAADGDVTWLAGATLFSIAFNMTGSATSGTTVFLGNDAMTDPKFRAAALTKAGAQAATSGDVAIGDFVISL